VSKFTEKMHSIIRSREVRTIPVLPVKVGGEKPTVVWTKTRDHDLITIPEVKAGVMLLDKVKPGWEQRINVETLNLESAMECVLGQLYGSYADGLSALWPRQQVGWQRLSWSSYDEWDQMAEAHGFEAPLGDRCTRRCVLAQEWKRHVLRKQYVSA